jgi:hypothetical protein
VKYIVEASKKCGLELNAEKTKYMLLSRRQNAGQNNIKIANRSFENVAQFKYLGTIVINRQPLWSSGQSSWLQGSIPGATRFSEE